MEKSKWVIIFGVAGSTYIYIHSKKILQKQTIGRVFVSTSAGGMTGFPHFTSTSCDTTG